MKTTIKSAMQLKAVVKNIAKGKNVPAQFVLQNYMLERFLERISISEHSAKIIIKGGLIASVIGLELRTTMDIDATIKQYPVKKDTIFKMISDISKIETGDGIEFEIKDIHEIREADEYEGYRVSLSANFQSMKIPIKLDLTTGDVITPKEIMYDYKLMLENRSIKVMAYNIETILAEKLETIISRSDQNTRLRDFYDIHTIIKLRSSDINMNLVAIALNSTAARRKSVSVMDNYKKVMDVIVNSQTMQNLWKVYQKKFNYASDITFAEVCNTINQTMDAVSRFIK